KESVNEGKDNNIFSKDIEKEKT
ncbi:hypothetical protein VSAK1_13568, partial [Vibrio mediterranei AK1]